MKSTITSDLVAWLFRPDDDTATGLSRAVLAVLYFYLSAFGGSRLLTNLIFARWESASHAASVVGGIAGAGAAALWGDRALYRWRDRTIARLEAERDAILAAQGQEGATS